jgi:diguanylate cyclase (GGDEF)-like protein/PAS domain S-box-containing protein
LVKSRPNGSDTAGMLGAPPSPRRRAGPERPGGPPPAAPTGPPTASVAARPTDPPPLRARLVREVINPTQAAVPVALAAYWLLHRGGYIAPVPFAALAAIVVAGQVASTAAHVAFPRELGGWRLGVRVGTELGAIGANIYAIGWGPTLAVGLVFGAADNIRVSGAKATRPALVAAAAVIVLGQAAYALGLGHPMLPQATMHAFGFMALLGTGFTVGMFAWSTARAEKAEAATRASERWFRAVVDHQADLTTVVDATGRILWVSPSYAAFAGRDAAEVIGRDALEVLAVDLPAGPEALAAELARPGATAHFEVRIRDAAGVWRWFDARATSLLDDPVVRGVVVNLHDVTDRRRLEADLRHRALHDDLTGLPNRRAFFEHVERLTRRAAGDGARVAVLYLDLDRFKVVNDSLGHDAGDELLRQVADRLREGLRPGDFVARLGGDEFTVVLAEVRDSDEAVRTAQRVTRLIEEPFSLHGTPVHVSASVGVAISDPQRPDPGSLLRHADLVMYDAKRDGATAAFGVFDAARSPGGADRFRLEVDLRAALEAGQLLVHFQPEVRVADGALVGLEALARWAHPELGLLEAQRFVPVAEDAGFVARLDELVLRQVVAHLAAWERAGTAAPEVAVNVSPQFLRRAGAADGMLELLGKAGLAPARLAIELTERVAMDDPHSLGELRRLHDAGCRVVIDDFGTGWSGLEYLRRLPVDRIKLDRTYVADLVHDPADAAIVEAVIGMGHAIGIEVTAEGVEQPAELDALRRLGCDRVQGRLLHPPLDPEAAAALLRAVGVVAQPMPSSRSRRSSPAPARTATSAAAHSPAPAAQAGPVAPKAEDAPSV